MREIDDATNLLQDGVNIELPKRTIETRLELADEFVIAIDESIRPTLYDLQIGGVPHRQYAQECPVQLFGGHNWREEIHLFVTYRPLNCSGIRTWYCRRLQTSLPCFHVTWQGL
jgi:hypothetical protein